MRVGFIMDAVDRAHLDQLANVEKFGTVPARDGETVATIRDVPAGTWAVLAYQDENANGELDRNLIGIPSENYGFSRDARGRFGPPSFDDAAMPIRDEAATATVRLH